MQKNCNFCSLGVFAHTVTHLQRTVDTVQVIQHQHSYFFKYPKYEQHNVLLYIK